MKDEYVIINKTSILKRIEQLEKRSQLGLTDEEWNDERGQEKALKQVLSQSTPLIPEIEMAFALGVTNRAIGQPLLYDFIETLKLDI